MAAKRPSSGAACVQRRSTWAAKASNRSRRLSISRPWVLTTADACKATAPCASPLCVLPTLWKPPRSSKAPSSKVGDPDADDWCGTIITKGGLPQLRPLWLWLQLWLPGGLLLSAKARSMDLFTSTRLCCVAKKLSRNNAVSAEWSRTCCSSSSNLRATTSPPAAAPHTSPSPPKPSPSGDNSVRGAGTGRSATRRSNFHSGSRTRSSRKPCKLSQRSWTTRSSSSRPVSRFLTTSKALAATAEAELAAHSPGVSPPSSLAAAAQGQPRDRSPSRDESRSSNGRSRWSCRLDNSCKSCCKSCILLECSNSTCPLASCKSLTVSPTAPSRRPCACCSSSAPCKREARSERRRSKRWCCCS
mmetsp:Transcript_82413/g.266924  ORF Transcript_82413/g.266924 Transcript_82413/m.266924 type:complete len:359 (-) Transcript_82413:563-1639(-)